MARAVGKRSLALWYKNGFGGIYPNKQCSNNLKSKGITKILMRAQKRKKRGNIYTQNKCIDLLIISKIDKATIIKGDHCLENIENIYQQIIYNCLKKKGYCHTINLSHTKARTDYTIW